MIAELDFDTLFTNDIINKLSKTSNLEEVDSAMVSEEPNMIKKLYIEDNFVTFKEFV